MDKLLKKAHFEYSKPYSYLASGIILEKKILIILMIQNNNKYKFK